MSIIVAVKKHDTLVIASDSAQTEAGMIVRAEYYVNNDKIIPCNDSYIGMVGWSCTQDIMESVIRENASDMNLNTRAEIFDTFRMIHSKLKEDYFIETDDDDKEQPVESSQIDALIASPTGIFEIESYRTVTEYTRFWALGSGKKLALGAMQAVYDRIESAEEIATAGVNAACAFDDACALPMEIYEINIQ